MGLPSPHLWHTKWLGFKDHRRGKSEEKKAQKPHSTERGSETRVLQSLHVRHAALPLVRQQPLRRHRREVVVAPGVTQPRTTAAAQRRSDEERVGWPESPTGPRVV